MAGGGEVGVWREDELRYLSEQTGVHDADACGPIGRPYNRCIAGETTGNCATKIRRLQNCIARREQMNRDWDTRVRYLRTITTTPSDRDRLKRAERSFDGHVGALHYAMTELDNCERHCNKFIFGNAGNITC